MAIETVSAALVERLRSVLPSQALLLGSAVTARSSNVWGAPKPIEAQVLVRPGSTAELSQTLATCHEFSQPVVVHGGQTGVVGATATQPGDVIVSLERMTRIEELDTLGRTMVAQAGVTLQRAQEEAERHGLLLGIDLGARGAATLGGNAATNAGGNRVVRYGMTRRHVLGLEVVLADGTVVSSMGRIIKDNAGYDLKQLFIGSEGTLGVISRLVLQLLPAPRSEHTAMAAALSLDAVARLLTRMNAELGGRVSAFEVLWSDYYSLVTTAPAKSKPPLPQGQPFYVLVESHGSDPAHDGERFENALAAALQEGLVSDVVIAKSTHERSALWALRDDVHQLWRMQPMFLFDVGLPIAAMQGYTESLRTQLKRRWPDALLYIFGHMGDGNLHVCIRAGGEDGGAKAEVEHLVNSAVAAIGGSVAAEHGIGCEKKSYLPFSRSAVEIELMRQLKRLLDPRNILNRGRVVDV